MAPIHRGCGLRLPRMERSMMSNTSYTTQLAVFCVLASAAGIACPFTCCADEARGAFAFDAAFAGPPSPGGINQVAFSEDGKLLACFSAVRHSQWAATLCYGMSGPPGVFGPGAAFPRLLCRTRPRTVSPPSRSPGSVWTVAGLRVEYDLSVPATTPLPLKLARGVQIDGIGPPYFTIDGKEPIELRSAYFSSDDKYLAAVGSDRSVNVWRVQSGERAWRFFPSAVTLSRTSVRYGHWRSAPTTVILRQALIATRVRASTGA